VTALTVVGFLVVVGVALAIPVWATDTPSYCTSCKATQAAGAKWEASAHAKVSCVDCHVPPGMGGAIKWRAREWRNIWADYLNVPRAPSKGDRPGSANCLACHSLNGIPESQGDVRMPHQVHVDLRNLTCADCHIAASHPEAGEGGNAVKMATCTMCHNTQGAPSECTFCHLTPPPKDTHPQDYIETHGKEALVDETGCFRCHHNKADFCDPCHAKPTPDHFSGSWRYTHKVAAAKDRSGCLGCHSEDAFCEQCHGVRHPETWPQTHGAVAGRGAAACLVCHPQAMCDQCHERQGVGD
jgi:nitrate/TMAO reductase-like tetraheme cytochrome c subunit